MRLPQCRPDERRIGVALTIPDPWGTRLRGARLSFGDAHADVVPAHITLIPPTCLSLHDEGLLSQHLTTVAQAVEPFTVRLRGTGTFRPITPVVFVQVAEGIGGCEQIHRLLMASLLSQDLLYPYHPHVTVAQEVDEDALNTAFDTLATFDATFTALHLDLYREDLDGTWRCAESHQLGTGTAGAPPPIDDQVR